MEPQDSPQGKHTPGPWVLIGDEVRAPRDLAEVGGIKICRVAISSVLGSEDDANARLIAAAPELLDACKRAEALLDGVIYDLLTGDALSETGTYDVTDALRAAIDRATGRAA